MASYYYLVSSLPVLDIENDNMKSDIMELFEYIRTNTESSDWKHIESVLYINDIKNLVGVIAKNHQLPRPHPGFNPLSKLPEEIINEYHNNLDRLPAFMRSVIEENDDKFANMNLADIENLFLQEYFNLQKDSDQRFVSAYAKFDLALRNILAALNSRKQQQAIDTMLLEDDETQHALSKSSAKDFGLSDQYPYITQLADLIEHASISDLDLFVDQLRWEQSSALSSGSIFEIDNILAYIIKLGIVKRRTERSKDSGKERLEFLTMQAIQNLEIPVGK